jgi:hypothetical protein
MANKGWKKESERHALAKNGVRTKVITKPQNIIAIPFDEHAVRELELFIDNDYNLYKQMIQTIQRNQLKKMNNGTWDSELSIKQFKNLADEGAKRYIKQHGSPGEKWYITFPVSERLEVAKTMSKQFVGEAELGNYDYLLTKR